MFSYYKELLFTGRRKSSNNSSSLVATSPPAKTLCTMVKTSVFEDEPNRPTVEVFHGSDEESEDDVDDSPFLVEPAEEIDDTFLPYGEDGEEEDIGTRFINGKPIPRSRPVPIQQPARRPLTSAEILDNEFLFGNYCNFRELDLLNERHCKVLDNTRCNVYAEIKEKVTRTSREELCADVVPIIMQDGSHAYFDTETITLMPEDHFVKILAKCPIEKKERKSTLFVIEEDENDNDEFLENRNPRGEFKKNVQKEGVIGKKVDEITVRQETCFKELINSDHIPLIPYLGKAAFDYGYPLEPEDPPIEMHSRYCDFQNLILVRKRAMLNGITGIEQNIFKGGDFDVIHVNRLIRIFYGEEEDEEIERQVQPYDNFHKEDFFGYHVFLEYYLY